MKNFRPGLLFLILLMTIAFESCIYDYPKGSGNNPSSIEAMIDLEFDITWDYLVYNIDFAGRARDERPHIFIFEIKRNGETVCRDEERISDADLASGRLRHRISSRLAPESYELAVWYEGPADDGDEEGIVFDTNDLNAVKISSLDTYYASSRQCGYACETIDLSGHEDELRASETVSLTLKQPGGRFRFIATDIQQFITEQRPGLLQGDTFSLHVIVDGKTLDTYSGRVDYTGENFEYSGHMWFPFADYDELNIGEGYLFCNHEESVKMTLLVYNSAMMIVTQTPTFTIPMKRGYITIVRGDLLSFPINGNFTINHIWDGEHVVEV